MKHLANKIVVPCDPEEIKVIFFVNVGYTVKTDCKSLQVPFSIFVDSNVVAKQVYTIINHENDLQ